MVEILKSISEISAVSGNENSLRDYILQNIKADNVCIDTMGNVIAFKKGNGKKGKALAIAAHIDECGMIVTDIADDGYIKFDLVGNVELRSIISKSVIINQKIKGIIGMKAIHLQKKDERENVKKADELYIDIGAKDKKSAESVVKTGDYISFMTNFAEIGDNIKGKALSRIGAAVLLYAAKSTFENDVYFVFTVQKEVGMRGAAVAANKMNVDLIYVIEDVQATDVAGVKKEEITVKTGCGPVITTSYTNAIINKNLTEKIFCVGEENDIPLQRVAVVKDKSDVGEFILHNGGANALTLGIPVRYSHTPVQIASKNDIENTMKLLKILLNKNN